MTSKSVRLLINSTDVCCVVCFLHVRHSDSLMGATYSYGKLQFSIKLAFGYITTYQLPGFNFIF